MSIGCVPSPVVGMAHQRWTDGEVSQAGGPASLHLPCSFQHGTCWNGFGTARHAYLLLLPAPVQIAGEVGGIRSVSWLRSPGCWLQEALNQQLGDLKDAVLYKGHKEEGMLGSRQTPWEKSIASIKEHPFFGTGYGTSPTGDDPGLGFGRFSSTCRRRRREHGSSYMTIARVGGAVGCVALRCASGRDGVEGVESLRLDEANRRPTPLLDSTGHGGVVGSRPRQLRGLAVCRGLLSLLYIFGFLRLCSRILSLTPLWSQQPALFPEFPVRRQPVLEPLCPTDDQIVYQWPCRERGWRPYLSAQCDSPSRAERGCGNYGPAESRNSLGVWGTAEHFICRGPGA